MATVIDPNNGILQDFEQHKDAKRLYRLNLENWLETGATISGTPTVAVSVISGGTPMSAGAAVVAGDSLSMTTLIQGGVVGESNLISADVLVSDSQQKKFFWRIRVVDDPCA